MFSAFYESWSNITECTIAFSGPYFKLDVCTLLANDCSSVSVYDISERAAELSFTAHM